MKASIFTTGSETVDIDAEEETDAIDYFRGLFTTVPTLVKDLNEIADVDVHILSDELGYVTGSESVGEAKPPKEDAAERLRNALLEAAESSDVVVLMLTNSTYGRVVEPVWEELVERSQEGTLWFVSASPSVLSSFDLGRFGESVVVYERVGVTRISNESRERLIDAVRRMA